MTSMLVHQACAEVTIGDFCDVNVLKTALEGVDTVFHVASVIDLGTLTLTLTLSPKP